MPEFKSIRQKIKIKVVSFDMDGTLVDRSFVDTFWEVEIPKLYAKKYALSFEEAQKIVKTCYDEIGDKDVRWYLPEYWFKRFNLSEDPRRILEKLKEKIKVFPDAISAIRNLYNKYTLIIVSNASKEFVEIELEKLGNYFSKVYSCTSDFGAVRKEPEVYLKICKDLGIRPEEMVHVGDHYQFDYQVPRSIGIKAFLIDRGNTLKLKVNSKIKDEILKSLEELPRKIQ